MKTAGINEEMAMDATDLTQLSSREQLSALMDGALPADQTRFLLRRLQHDDSLAECWERWRLSAEVMRGLAPAQRLPADFASRVSASLRGEARRGEECTAERFDAAATRQARDAFAGMAALGWRRGDGGLAGGRCLHDPADLAGSTSQLAWQHRSRCRPVACKRRRGARQRAVRQTPAPQAPAQDPQVPQAARRSRHRIAGGRIGLCRCRRDPARAQHPTWQPVARTAGRIAVDGVEPCCAPWMPAVAVTGDIQPLLPQSEITTHPWPRSVLPQYGNAGHHGRFRRQRPQRCGLQSVPGATAIGNLPPALITQPATEGATSSDADETVGRRRRSPSAR